MAGGFEVALACDLIVAARDAKVGIPEVKRGLVAAAGALIRLPKRIPYHLAMELALTGDPITAERAHEIGIVNRLAEPGEAVAAARELAAAIVRNGPLAIAGSKKIMVAAQDWTEEEAWERQGEIAGPDLHLRGRPRGRHRVRREARPGLARQVAVWLQREITLARGCAAPPRHARDRGGRCPARCDARGRRACSPAASATGRGNENALPGRA